MTTLATAMITTVLLTAATSPAHAQPQKLRPGLWEHTVSMKSQSGQMEAAMAEMQKSMASMSPEQRRQMEQTLGQHGVGMGPKGNTVKICISAEQADLGNVPPQKGCTQNVKRTGPQSVSMSFRCEGAKGEAPTSGEGSMTFSGPTAYTGTFKVKTTTEGRAEQIDMVQTGAWLTADCGAIKPAR